MSEEIIKVLDDLASRMGVAIDWSSDNVLPYLTELVERYVKYEMFRHYLWIAFWCVMIILIIISIISLIRNANYARVNKKGTLLWTTLSSGKIYEPEPLGVILMVFVLFGTFLTLMFLPTAISNILELSIIPEVYIYENLLKGVL